MTTPRNLTETTKTEREEIGRILAKNGSGSVVLQNLRKQYNLTESAVVRCAQVVDESLAKAKGITESTLTETTPAAPPPGLSAQELNDRRRAELVVAGANRAQQNMQAASTQDLENLAVMLSGN
jgi:hypothetical protein